MKKRAAGDACGRGKGPKVNGYAHTNTSERSRKTQRRVRHQARRRGGSDGDAGRAAGG